MAKGYAAKAKKSKQFPRRVTGVNAIKRPRRRRNATCFIVLRLMSAMNRIAAFTCVTITLIGGLNAAEPASPQEQQLLHAIKEVQGQQTMIADNQAKIDAKLLTVAEAIRLARIFASRSGN